MVTPTCPHCSSLEIPIRLTAGNKHHEHIVLCLEGELNTELKDGRVFVLKPGMSYQLGDGVEPHRSYAEVGATLFVVD